MRWWNVKHPAVYQQLIGAGVSPGAGRELLDAPTRERERILLSLRLRTGLSIDSVMIAEKGRVVAELIAVGLVDGRSALAGKLVLTVKGRLLCDAVVRRLVVD